jgi:hypothetical protein
MAGEWIKMAVGLRTHPKVVRMATMLKADRLRVVGGLHAVWGLFDTHSVAGQLDGYTAEVMDADLGWKGFTAAMLAVGWLEETPEGVAAPDYEEHNGPNAKRRAMETSRKGRSRNKSADGPHDEHDECGQVSASDADKMRNREEKRREEEPPIAPKGAVDPPGFAEFWATWPSTARKQDRKKCAEKWKRSGFAADLPAIVAHVQALKLSKSWREGFDPAPLTYLNGERWRDGTPVGAAAGAPTGDIFAGAH